VDDDRTAVMANLAPTHDRDRIGRNAPRVPMAIEGLFFNSRPVVVDFDDPCICVIQAILVIRARAGRSWKHWRATAVTTGSSHLSN
jgi:hypothetical protein